MLSVIWKNPSPDRISSSTSCVSLSGTCVTETMFVEYNIGISDRTYPVKHMVASSGTEHERAALADELSARDSRVH